METNSVVFFNTNPYPQPTHKPIIAAWKMSNPANIGSLMRLADNLGCDEIFILSDPLSVRPASVKYTAGQSFKTVRLNVLPVEDFFAQLPADYRLVAIETSEKSTNLYTTQLPDKVIFLLGSERYGLPEEILTICQQVVHIPMPGACKSMNVSHALAVVLFEWLRQQMSFQ